MFIPWLVFIITAIYCHDTEVPTSIPNVTTLYPINQSITSNDSEFKPSEKLNPQTWKFEATLAAPNLMETETNNSSDSKEGKEEKEELKEELKDFKPSQPLGSFFDEDAAEVIKTPIAGPVVQRPSGGFVSSISNNIKYNKVPDSFYKIYKQFPYKYDNSISTKGKLNWQEDPLESKPTVESPVNLPAGGLYNSPFTFKERPSSKESFGLSSDEAKRHPLHKREDPWQNILRLLTAFVPMGLIISALTPSVINIQNVDDKRNPSSIYRRSDPDPGMTDLAPISEQCRRRLLCELHSDRYYTPPISSRRLKAKLCYKLQCEDTNALWRTLNWLFTYNQPADTLSGRHLT